MRFGVDWSGHARGGGVPRPLDLVINYNGHTFGFLSIKESFVRVKCVPYLGVAANILGK